MIPLFLKKRIALHFAFILSLVITAVTTATQGYRFYENYTHLKTDLQEKIEGINRFSALSLSQAIWNLDKNYAQAIATIASSDENVLLFTVTTDQKEFISIHQEPLHPQAISLPFFPSPRATTVITPIFYDSKPIGELLLRYSLDEYYTEIWSIFWISLFHEICIILLIVTLVFIFSKREILNPIQKIETFSSQISRGEFHHKLDFDLPNEIGTLAQNLEIMRDSIESSFQKLQESNETLEQKVHERTKELREINQDLLVAREKAELASQAKARFLANMSHELRTPLTGIIGFSELLIEDFETPESNPQHLEDLIRIRSAGKHLLNMINDILDFSKIESGKMDIYPEAFNLRSLLDETIGIMKPSFQTKNNLLTLNASDAAVEMIQDSKKIRQALLNLLSNANKFTTAGKVTLHVFTKVEQGDSITRFRVTDSGIGMTSEQQEKLFQSFHQADASISHRFGGTGLGLSITKSFAELMGGSVEVTSTLGQGSCFQLNLPTRHQKTKDQ